ncbi:hypothetical protein GBAR_LOCUS18112, partial [Geodia barretti]
MQRNCSKIREYFTRHTCTKREGEERHCMTYGCQWRFQHRERERERERERRETLYDVRLPVE